MRRHVEGGIVVAEVPVPDSDDIVVLLDPEQRPADVPNWHPFHNVLRLSQNGDIVWRAELVPGESTAKCWLRINFEDGLTAWTYSYVCKIDPANGRIIETEFTK